MGLWRTKVRFLGAGTIGIAAIWTLAKLAKPVVGGLVASLRRSQAAATGDPLDEDLGPNWIVGLTVACLAVAGVLTWRFLAGTVLADRAGTLVFLAVPFVFVVGFAIAGVAGYMAGLIGASNSPISGIGILGIVSCASLFAAAVPPDEAVRPALVAVALFVTSIVFACATISNDNLQDLKTGQLVGASPRKQQVALIVGVVAGAAVIPSVLNLLARAYGFAGAANVGVLAQNPLPAPQATLISALAQGVVGGALEWNMIGLGAVLGAALIALDAALKAAKKGSLPVLAVGIGIYLPMSVTFAVVLGALAAKWYEHRTARAADPGRAERLGTLVASGMIVGESLFGVLNAALIVARDTDAPIALVGQDFAAATLLGVVGFAGLVVACYRWMVRRAA